MIFEKFQEVEKRAKSRKNPHIKKIFQTSCKKCLKISKKIKMLKNRKIVGNLNFSQNLLLRSLDITFDVRTLLIISWNNIIIPRATLMPKDFFPKYIFLSPANVFLFQEIVCFDCKFQSRSLLIFEAKKTLFKLLEQVTITKNVYKKNTS